MVIYTTGVLANHCCKNLKGFKVVRDSGRTASSCGGLLGKKKKIIWTFIKTSKWKHWLPLDPSAVKESLAWGGLTFKLHKTFKVHKGGLWILPIGMRWPPKLFPNLATFFNPPRPTEKKFFFCNRISTSTWVLVDKACAYNLKFSAETCWVNIF